MNKRFAATAALLLTSLLVLAAGCRDSNSPNDVGAPDSSVQTASVTADDPVSDVTTAQPPTETSAPRPDDLLRRRFALVEVNGKAFDVEEPVQRPDIEFNEGLQITGRVCNRFRGPAELNDGKLHAENLVSTMMLCVNSELDELERRFFAMLRAGADISIGKDDRLIIEQGGYTLVYKRAE